MNILIAEDDKWYSELLNYHISLDPDNIVQQVSTAGDLLKAVSKKTDIVTLDYSLPDSNGNDVLRQIKNISPNTEVIIVSGQEDVKTAISLLKEGAYDYIVKDEDTKDRIWKTIQNIKNQKELQAEVDVLRTEVIKKYDFSKTIIGSSEALKRVFPLLEKATKSNINISISGETGTGKEVVAKAIHYNSDRKKQPFIAINVSAIPSELIESELFGHEKGAFTGAASRKIGKFEAAKSGTIFLDEMGEMDINMQAKLLRVLQERELVRVGGNEIVKLNCRIICATHKNLQEEVTKGNFRQDLYFRIIGLPIELPPLRDRKEDIILLARYFIEAFAKDNQFEIKQLDETASKKLLSYSFPGNVRELKAIVDLAMVLSEGNIIESSDIQFHSSNPINDLAFKEMSLKDFNYKIIDFFMDKYNGNVLKVAEVLDIGKSTIYRMIKEKE
ncbi:MAG: two-component system response regulator AtoC [Parvicella sp.]|jgi:two-component system response regulator AtoC